MEKHIYFVRHGQTNSNADQLYRGRNELLTDEGHAQATLVAERIKRIGVDAVISSTFERAKETAAAIGRATGLVPEASAHFVEWLEPSSHHGLHVGHPARAGAREVIARNGEPHFRHEDEETFAELVARAKEGVAFMERHPANRLCVVSHGSFLKVLIGVFVFGDQFTKPLFQQMYHHMSTTNTGVTEVRWNDERSQWQLITWNDISHFG